MISKNRMPYLRACRGEKLKVTPVWLMRQAGRYLPEYRAVRKKYGFLDICYNPELATEVTLQPIRRFKFDASILFSDILVPLVPMGANLSFGPGEGPRIDPPIRTISDIEKLQPVNAQESLHFVLKAISMIRRELPDDVALIGFVGAPFTLATYLIEGGKPAPFGHVKSLMYKEPEAFGLLMGKLQKMATEYLKAMVTAGADAVQVFDTWAGTLAYHDFQSANLPYIQKIFQSLADLNVPMTYFVHGGSHLLREIKDTGCTVASLDWRCSLSEARDVLGNKIAIQGNLDATVLLGDERTIRSGVRRVLEDAGEGGGHIFNLGHGILPMTPVSSVEIMLDEIRGQK